MLARRLRRLCGLLLLGAAISAAAAETPRSLAVVSEMAREVRIIAFQGTTGTRLGNSAVNRVPVAQGALDTAALQAAQAAIARAEPSAKVWLVAPIDSDLFDPRADFSPGASVALPADLAAALRERGSTQLLLFTRFRANAATQFSNGRLDAGQFEGVGFFVDQESGVRDTEAEVRSTGYLAPFIYFRATLIDARTSKVLASRRVTESRVMVANQAQAGDGAWNLLSPRDKVQRLIDLVRSEVDKAVPPLLAATP